MKGWLSDDHVLKGDGTLTLKPGVHPAVLPVLTFTADGVSSQVISLPLAALVRPSGLLCIMQFEQPQQSLITTSIPNRIVFGSMVVSTMLLSLDYNNGLVGVTQRSVPAADSSSTACAAARTCRDVETFILERNTCHHPCSNRWFFKYDAAKLECSSTGAIPSTIFAVVVALVSIEMALAFVSSNAGAAL